MTLEAVLVVAAALFAVGLYGALSQQVVVMVMMGLELMINGVLLAAAGFWWFLAPDPSGQVLLLVVLLGRGRNQIIRQYFHLTLRYCSCCQDYSAQ